MVGPGSVITADALPAARQPRCKETQRGVKPVDWDGCLVNL